VPAMRDHSPSGLTQSSEGSSVSPETRPVALAHMSDRILAPPPVDFTGYNSKATTLPHHSGPRLPELQSTFRRQSRSPGSTPGNRDGEILAPIEPSNQLPPIMSQANPTPPARLSPISSILNQGTGADESKMAGYRHSPPLHSPLPSPGQPDSYLKIDRRSQLQREAEQMREALKAKERELAELER
jgi:hypothetical protein